MFRCNFRKRFKSHSLTFFTYLILSLRFSIKLKVFDKSFRLLIEQRFNSRISRILFSNFFNIFGILILKLFKKKLALSLLSISPSIILRHLLISNIKKKKKVREKKKEKGNSKGIHSILPTADNFEEFNFSSQRSPSKFVVEHSSTT